MKPKTKSNLLTAGGYSLSVVAPLVATATQFPLFVQKGAGATVSGAFLLVLIISALPLLFYLKKLKDSNRTLPKSNTAMLLWGVVLAVTVAFYQIADELIIISSAGAGGSIACKVMTAFADKEATKAKTQNTAETTKQVVNELLQQATEQGE